MLALSMLVIPMAVMFNLCRTPGAERPFLYGSKGLGDGQTALLLMFYLLSYLQGEDARH